MTSGEVRINSGWRAERAGNRLGIGGKGHRKWSDAVPQLGAYIGRQKVFPAGLTFFGAPCLLTGRYNIKH